MKRTTHAGWGAPAAALPFLASAPSRRAAASPRRAAASPGRAVASPGRAVVARAVLHAGPRGARSRLLRGRATPVLLGLALAGLAPLLAGCGESSQEKAAKSVCAARSDIKQRVNALQALTPSIAALPQIKTEVSAIAKDLEKIKDQQPNLEPARRQKIEQATKTFEGQLQSVLSNLTKSLSLSGAATQLEAALKQLQSSYVQALEPIQCSG